MSNAWSMVKTQNLPTQNTFLPIPIKSNVSTTKLWRPTKKLNYHSWGHRALENQENCRAFSKTLHSEIQNTNCIVGKTCGNLVNFLVPANFKYAPIACISFDNLVFLQWPDVHGFIKRSTGQILTIWAKCNRNIQDPWSLNIRHQWNWKAPHRL